MRPEFLSYLRDPTTHAPLALAQDVLIDSVSGARYPIRNDIPIFLKEVTGVNRKYQTMYDRLAPGYDIAERIYKWFSRKPDYRLDYIRELEISAGACVLEVSVGTGANLPYLSTDVEFFGLDLSWGMLSKCLRKLRSLPYHVQLFQGEAEHLPFNDAAFDCVFHVGGINFFNDKAQAIKEMIRVAKPGTKILIVDETEKVVSGLYQKNPLTQAYFKGQGKEAYCPIGLIPPEMDDIQSRQIAEGKLYCLTFRKPANLNDRH